MIYIYPADLSGKRSLPWLTVPCEYIDQHPDFNSMCAGAGGWWHTYGNVWKEGETDIEMQVRVFTCGKPFATRIFGGEFQEFAV